MNASVIIPTHNREEILQRVLGYYARQVGAVDFEIIVVDDGSTDGTRSLFEGLRKSEIKRKRICEEYGERIRELRKGWYRPDPGENLVLSTAELYLTFVHIEKAGRSVARNVGVCFSAYPLIIFADDDIFVEPEFVKKHVESHHFDDRLVVMGRVLHTQDLQNPFSAGWKLKDINTAFLSTGNASVLKKHIIDAGLFDETYTVYGWEDFDLGIHLSELGLDSVKKRINGYHYAPALRSIRPADVYEKEKERGLSAVYFYKTHPLRWVERFTLIHNAPVRGLVKFLGLNNWFLSRNRISLLKGLLLLIIRYKGYFDGIEEGLKLDPENEAEKKKSGGPHGRAS